jgi:hypothetical protein
MAGPIPAMHVFWIAFAWMPGTIPGMTRRDY